MFKKNFTPFNGILVLVLIGLLILPRLVDPYWVVFLLLLFMYIGIGSSFNITAGYLGYVNLGHYVFFGISAYGFAILYAKGIQVNDFDVAVLGAERLADKMAAHSRSP